MTTTTDDSAAEAAQAAADEAFRAEARAFLEAHASLRQGFGDTTIRVSAVPALLRIEDSSKALLALADDLEGLDRGGHVQEALRRLAATTACHAAVKANYPLTFEKMAHILEELRATAYSTVCTRSNCVCSAIARCAAARTPVSSSTGRSSSKKSPVASGSAIQTNSRTTRRSSGKALLGSGT